MDDVPDIRHQLTQLAQLLMMDNNTLPPVASIQPFKNVGKFADGKCIDTDEWSSLEAQAAFLGPNIWDKSTGFENELQLGDQYMDLDEFLNASCVGDSQQSIEGSEKSEEDVKPIIQSESENEEEDEVDEDEEMENEPDLQEEIPDPPSPASSTSSIDSDDSYRPPPKKRGRKPRATKADHRSKSMLDDGLKPLTMVKKSRKQFVPDEKKDDKYWARRRKNNMAAKRSRDARRAKENQIVVKAGHLEKQNYTLKEENEKLKKENKKLKAELAKYKK